MTSRGISAEQTVEAVRRGAEACERSLGMTTERELVKALVGALPACNCGAPATLDYSGLVGSDRLACDACRHEVEHEADRPEAICDIDYAHALRALLERMKAWGAPMPGAGEALLADEGGQG